MAGSSLGTVNMSSQKTCENYLLFQGESSLSDGMRAFLYLLALAYCFLGLSAITARFFQSMENIVKHTREVVEIDPVTNTKVIRREKFWNYVIADITLLAFGTSFPQISLATIDAIRNIGQLTAGGMLFISIVTELVPLHLKVHLHFLRRTLLLHAKHSFLALLFSASTDRSTR